MLALAQCWFTRKHVPTQSGRRNREGVYHSDCQHCRRSIVSWDRTAWHLAEGFNLLQLTQGAEEAFLFLVDTRDDMVVARFPIDHLDTEAGAGTLTSGGLGIYVRLDLFHDFAALFREQIAQ